MPAPTNVSFATATDLGTLPADVVQTVDDAGTTYEVFYKFTAPAGAVEIGAFGFGDLAVYKPLTVPYDATETQILSIGSVRNVPIQFPVTAGALYYLRIGTNAGNPSPAVLTLNVQAHQPMSMQVGDIAVNDDTTGFPLAVASGLVDDTIIAFVKDFPAGESGDTLNNGTVLMEDISDTKAKLYSNAFVLQATLPTTGIDDIRTHIPSQKFYVAYGSTPAEFGTVTSAGIASALTTLTGSTTLGTLAANTEETVLYHAPTAVAAAVKRWDITGGAALTDLVAGIANYRVFDLIVLTDDTILVNYSKTSATNDTNVIRYSAAGAILNTYPFGQYAASFASVPRLATAIDDPLSFWIMHHETAVVGTTKFKQIRVSDGTVLTTRTGVLYPNGTYGGTATATPLARFGTSASCPFWIIRAGAPASTTTYTIRRQRRGLLPSSPDNKRVTIPTLELLMRTGIGLLPDAESSITPLGVDPEVRLRISKDGGKTWGPERAVSAGTRGNYKDRVRWLQATGNYRNGVFEITVDDPVDWQMLALFGDVIEGSS